MFGLFMEPRIVQGSMVGLVVLTVGVIGSGCARVSDGRRVRESERSRELSLTIATWEGECGCESKFRSFAARQKLCRKWTGV